MSTNILIPTDTQLYRTFQAYATNQRIVFFAGLPGVGKSLLLQQLTHMAHDAGRTVHLLQWDVTRAAFETDEILARYPEVDGVTHAMIRKAVGLWARDGVRRWHEAHPTREQMLIGEVPLVGNRLMELVQKLPDEAESLLASEQTVFAIPVPSREIRALIERAREKTMSAPRHERERNDASPHVLRALWHELAQVAQTLGIAPESNANKSGGIRGDDYNSPTYHPTVYEEVYRTLLRHRHSQALPLTQRLETTAHSVYNLAVEPAELMASADEVAAFIHAVARQYPDLSALEGEVRQWYIVG